MSTKDETQRMLESSEERRNRRVDDLLKDTEVKAAIHRDQRPKPETNNKKSRRIA